MPEHKEAKLTDEIVAVDATMSAVGELVVRSIVRQGRLVIVTDTGRQWAEAADGGLRRCVLVMTAGSETLELCLEPADMLWHARPVAHARTMV